MTPEQLNAIEAVRGAPLSQDQIDRITPLVDARIDAPAAVIASEGLQPVLQRTDITERGVQELPVLPRAWFALLTVIKDAAAQEPAWLAPTLAAVGVPAEDRPALAYSLSTAYAWIRPGGSGLDIASAPARAMLDVIAAAVPDAAPACAALKLKGERARTITAAVLTETLNGVA